MFWNIVLLCGNMQFFALSALHLVHNWGYFIGWEGEKKKSNLAFTSLLKGIILLELFKLD